MEATINIGSNSNDLSYDYQWTASPDPTAANGPTLNNPTTPVTQVTVFTTTQFTLSAYESGVLVGSDVIVVTVIDKPLAAVAADVTICEGDNVQIGSASVLVILISGLQVLLDFHLRLLIQLYHQVQLQPTRL